MRGRILSNLNSFHRIRQKPCRIRSFFYERCQILMKSDRKRSDLQVGLNLLDYSKYSLLCLIRIFYMQSPDEYFRFQINKHETRRQNQKLCIYLYFLKALY
jgi:hypothetical protein